MYLDGLSFLEDERDAWRPYEALLELDDDVLLRPVPGAHGWSGRDLMVHLVAWQEVSLVAARELAVAERSPSMAASNAEWKAKGDAMNDEIVERWASVPLDEVRRRFREVAGELRGYLTVVPEARWVKDPPTLASFVGGTIEHYDDHAADLAAILAAAR